MAVSTQPMFDDLELLAQVSQLWTEGDLNYVLREVVKLAAKSVGAVRASLFIQDSEALHLSNFIVGTDDFLPPESGEIIQQVVQRGLAGWVLRHGEGTIVADTSTDERWYNVPGTQHQARSALSVPFTYHHELPGVITLVHDEPHYFNERHLRLMTIISNQVALAVHNAQAFYQAKVQRSQLQAILQAIPDMLLVLDEDECVVIASDAVQSLIGEQEIPSIVGQPIAQLSKIDSLFMAIHDALAEVEQHKGDYSFEARSERSDRDFLVHITTRDQEEGYIIVMNDVTALRNLSRFKDAMLRLVSHDLRTPLIVITGYADLLEYDLANDPARLEYVQGILEASKRMDRMLGNMLRVEKLRSTPAELHENVNLNLLVAELMHDLYPLAAQKEIQLDVQLTDEAIPEIRGDSMLLRQAMENFVSNAIKYTPSGGAVQVRAYAEGSRFYFVVRDTGIGIAKDDLPFVFESYYRGHNADSQSTKGMGLGLSLVKSVVTQHHGQVWVESEENRGSTFGLWLPLS
jgi:signal transduction histidine kinase